MAEKKGVKPAVEEPVRPPLIVGDGQDFNTVLMGQYKKIVTNFMGEEERARKFVVSVVNAIQKVPKLQNCTSTSLINSFMTMADAGFMPSDVMGQAYVIPYGTTATFQISYLGVIDLMRRAGLSELSAEIVREGDIYSHKGGKYYHEIDMTKSSKERGEVIGAIAVASINGGRDTEFMNIKDILDHRDKYSQSYKNDIKWNKKDSPWHTSPEAMYKKTVILQLSKVLSKSDKFLNFLAKDYAGESTINNRLSEANRKAENSKMGNLIDKENEKNAQNKEDENKSSEGDKK